MSCKGCPKKEIKKETKHETKARITADSCRSRPTCGESLDCNRTVSFCATSLLPKGWDLLQVGPGIFVGGYTYVCDLKCSVQPCIFKTEITNLPNPCGPDAPPLNCMAEVVLNRFFLIGNIDVLINVAVTPTTLCPGVTTECGFGDNSLVSYVCREICIPVNNLICVSCSCDCDAAFPDGFIDSCTIDSITAGVVTSSCGDQTVSLSGSITFKMCSA